MSVITNNTIQPSSGQVLTIKDEGGTASITVQTDGDLTLAENAYLGSGKGIYFDGQTTSANQLSDYEEGTFSLGNTKSFASQTCLYTRIGRYVFICGHFTNSGGGAMNSTFTNLPFIVENSDGAESGGVVTWHNENAPGSVGNYKLYPHKNTTTFQVYAEGSGTTVSASHDFSSDRTVRFFLNYLTSS